MILWLGIGAAVGAIAGGLIGYWGKCTGVG